jgi:dTDP-4-amino-4,6-dideoxy-D-galactose acyltransferase
MIEYLDWDSNFLGYKTGSIYRVNCESVDLLLEKAISEKYKLIYLFTDEACFLPEELLRKFNGKLVDRKVLYFQEVSEQDIANYEKTKRYTKHDITEDLLQLAYESGKKSRFKLDENFAPEVFTEMYKLWIEKSVQGQMADLVYVVEKDNEIVAMVTLKAKSETLHIGLIASAVGSQGKGYGKQLINRTKQTAIDLGLKNIEVPTQFDNTQACCFYEACGFKVKSIMNIYHFWL